jgi:hypothetical protein
MSFTELKHALCQRGVAVDVLQNLIFDWAYVRGFAAYFPNASVLLAERKSREPHASVLLAERKSRELKPRRGELILCLILYCCRKLFFPSSYGEGRAQTRRQIFREGIMGW